MTTTTRLASTLQVLCHACAQDCGPFTTVTCRQNTPCRLSFHCHLVDRHSALGLNNISTSGCDSVAGILFALSCVSQWDFAPAMLLNRQLYSSPQSSHMTLRPLCVRNKRIPVVPAMNIKSWKLHSHGYYVWAAVKHESLCCCGFFFFASAQLFLCNGTFFFFFTSNFRNGVKPTSHFQFKPSLG